MVAYVDCYCCDYLELRLQQKIYRLSQCSRLLYRSFGMSPRCDIISLSITKLLAKSSRAHLPRRQSTALLNPAPTQSGGVIISSCPTIIDQSIASLFTKLWRDLRWTRSSIKCDLSYCTCQQIESERFFAHCDLRERCWRVKKSWKTKVFIIEQFLSANDNFSSSFRGRWDSWTWKFAFFRFL